MRGGGGAPVLSCSVGETVGQKAYAAGGRNLGADGRRAPAPSPLRSEGLTGFAINRQQRGELIAFLESLTDDGLANEPRFADPFPPQSRAVMPPVP